jgi:hypothetical protein
MFTTEDVIRLITYLGLPISQEWIDWITARLGVLQTIAPYLTEQIKDDLDRLDELDELLQTNIGIKKADVVEFDVVQRSMGLITRSIQLIRRLAAKLSNQAVTIEPNLSSLQEQLSTLTNRSNDPLTINKVLG